MIKIALMYWLGAALYGLICTVSGLKSVRVKNRCELLAAAWGLTPSLVFHGAVIFSSLVWPISVAFDVCRLIDEKLIQR